MALDVNKLVSENDLFCFKLSCHGRNRFHNLEGMHTDEHSLYFDEISHSASLVTDFVEIQLVLPVVMTANDGITICSFSCLLKKVVLLP